MLSEDVENIFWGMTGLKPGKKGMFDEVLLSLTVVLVQSKVENGGKLGMGGGCGRDGGHGVTARGEEMRDRYDKQTP